MSPLSIIVPAYNEEEFLPSCLSSIEEAVRTCGVEAEVIVVDNNSTDTTAEIATRHGASVVFEPHNQISRARNRGARSASGRMLLFLDADTLLSAELLSRALDLLGSGSVCGCGSVIEMAPPLGGAAGRILACWNWLAARRHLAAGCFIACKKEAFEEAGGFSESVYAGEEVWFSMALKRWGTKRNMRFQVIDKPAIRTSSRKAQWFDSRELLGTLLLFVLFPFLMRFRSFCGVWYRRSRAAVRRPQNEDADLQSGVTPRKDRTSATGSGNAGDSRTAPGR